MSLSIRSIAVFSSLLLVANCPLPLTWAERAETNITHRSNNSKGAQTQPPAATIQVQPQQGPSVAPTITQAPPAPPKPTSSLSTTPQPEGERVLIIPEDTILAIGFDQSLNSKTNKVNEQVQATILEPVFLGPFLAIPKHSTISGVITHVNNGHDKSGHHPYIVVEFEKLHRPGDKDLIPISATFIAYKTGMRSQHLGQLPDVSKQKYKVMQQMAGGAAAGVAINPIFGPFIGAGASLLKSTIIDRFAKGGEVRVKANQPVPITVSKAIDISVVDTTTPLASKPPVIQEHAVAQPVPPTPAPYQAQESTEAEPDPMSNLLPGGE